jgi:hypothetical protein
LIADPVEGSDHFLEKPARLGQHPADGFGVSVLETVEFGDGRKVHDMVEDEVDVL